ncbi:MAG: primosomal protein N' family DNA-binding protein, partial [Ktedonobacterales bacterium]
MRVELLMPQRTLHRAAQAALFTYLVPDSLATRILPGHLVAAPFGERLIPAIVWSLDASDDATASTPDTSNAPAEPAQPLRPIAGILLDEPLLHPTQRALAEWLADHYAAPLAATARLMLPPGLLRGLRTVLRLRESPPDTDSTTDTSADAPPDHLTLAATLDDDGVVLGMLRTRGSLDRRQIESVLGRSRALASIRRLIAQRRVVLAVELSEAILASRRERRVHAVASPASLDAWRAQARATLDPL